MHQLRISTKPPPLPAANALAQQPPQPPALPTNQLATQNKTKQNKTQQTTPATRDLLHYTKLTLTRCFGEEGYRANKGGGRQCGVFQYVATQATDATNPAGAYSGHCRGG